MPFIKVDPVWSSIKGYIVVFGAGVLVGAYLGGTYQYYKFKALQQQQQKESVISVLEDKVIKYLKDDAVPGPSQKQQE